jgi:hypothetical protein
MKWILIGVALVALFLMGIVWFDASNRPASWEGVHLGDSRADLMAKYPQTDDHMYATKNIDVLVERSLAGHWVTFYSFDLNDKISGKALQYRLGTLRHFKTLESYQEEK